MRVSVFLFAALAAAHAADLDSARGAAVFVTQGCAECHANISLMSRSFSPTVLATTIWNHAPLMWKTVRSKGATPPSLDEQASGDLFAYFYSARLFETPGDAGRGKHVFQERGCSGCHGLGSAGSSAGLPVAQWNSFGEPVKLAEAMWNHSSNMQQELSHGNRHWPQLSAQDLTDLQVFIRNSPAGRGKSSAFIISSSSESGAALFKSKGCEECHGAGKISLDNRLTGLSLTAIAARMWNHAPLMSKSPARFEGDEMRDLLSYLWARQFFNDHGDPARGRHLFTAKHCSTCHDNASEGAPHLPAAGGKFNGVSMVSALWRHGPAMLTRMRDKSIAWPRLETREMSDIIAYLNAGDQK